MTTIPDTKPTRLNRLKAHAPRPMPGWLQVGVVSLLVVQVLQMLTHHNGPSLSANAAPGSTPSARIDYFYQPDDLSSARSQPPAFPYASEYAHAPGAVNLTPIRAYDATAGRLLDRDPLPAP